MIKLDFVWFIFKRIFNVFLNSHYSSCTACKYIVVTRRSKISFGIWYRPMNLVKILSVEIIVACIIWYHAVAMLKVWCEFWNKINKLSQITKCTHAIFFIFFLSRRFKSGSFSIHYLLYTVCYINLILLLCANIFFSICLTHSHCNFVWHLLFSIEFIIFMCFVSTSTSFVFFFCFWIWTNFF